MWQCLPPLEEEALDPSNEKKSRAGLLLLGVMGALLLCVGAGVLALVVVPKFVHFGSHSHSKASEAKSNLKALYIASKAYYAETDAYSPSLKAIGAELERGNRYAYFLAEPVGGATIQDRAAWPPAPGAASDVGLTVDTHKFTAAAAIARGMLPSKFLGEPLGVTGKCPACEITIAAGGNIDTDPFLDVWSISTKDRVDADGNKVPAGTPFCEADDTRD